MLNIEVVSSESVLRGRTGQVIQPDQKRCWVSSLYGAVSWPTQSFLTRVIKSDGKIQNSVLSDSLHKALELPTDWLTSCVVCTPLYPDLELTLLSSLPFFSCHTAKVNTQRWSTGRQCPEDSTFKQVEQSSKHNKVECQCLWWHNGNLQTPLSMCEEGECSRGRTAQPERTAQPL